MKEKQDKFQKVNKKIRKHLFVIAAVIALVWFFTKLFPESNNSIISILAWILVCYAMLGYFNLVFKFSGKREMSSLERRIKAPKNNLYQWLGYLNWDDISFYQLLKEEEDSDIFRNLQEIKKAIKVEVGKDIYDYYILKKYLEYHSKHNFLNGVWRTFGLVIFGGLAGAFAKLGIFDQIIKRFSNEQNNSAAFEQVEIITQVGVMSLLTLIIILFIKNELTIEKRRIDLLIIIVDTIIKEKEEKEGRK